MKLTDQQKQTMESWVNEGLGLSEIQKKMANELDLTMTYLDVRFLIIDLGLELQEEESSKPSEDIDSAPSSEETATDDAVEKKLPKPDDALSGKVSIEVDRLMKPGALVSGNVTFSDGETSSWMLDQLGRLALQPTTPDYKPSEEDIEAFQDSLRDELEKKGMA